MQTVVEPALAVGPPVARDTTLALASHPKSSRRGAPTRRGHMRQRSGRRTKRLRPDGESLRRRSKNGQKRAFPTARNPDLKTLRASVSASQACAFLGGVSSITALIPLAGFDRSVRRGYVSPPYPPATAAGKLVQLFHSRATISHSPVDS